jgi:hypothetical protein
MEPGSQQKLDRPKAEQAASVPGCSFSKEHPSMMSTRTKCSTGIKLAKPKADKTCEESNVDTPMDQ